MNLLEDNWVRGKDVPRGTRATPCQKLPNDCNHPPSAIQKGGHAVMYHERASFVEASASASLWPFRRKLRRCRATTAQCSRQQGDDQSRSSALFALRGTGAW